MNIFRYDIFLEAMKDEYVTLHMYFKKYWKKSDCFWPGKMKLLHFQMITKLVNFGKCLQETYVLIRFDTKTIKNTKFGSSCCQIFMKFVVILNAQCCLLSFLW